MSTPKRGSLKKRCPRPSPAALSTGRKRDSTTSGSILNLEQRANIKGGERVGHDRGSSEPELTLVIGLRIRCDDCGHRHYWPQSVVRQAVQKGFKTIPGLGSKLRCDTCKDRGGSGKNISLIPVLRGTGPIGSSEAPR